ncbi:MAG: hydroxypyruvate isomerase family protein [Pirellulales bacterium]
MPSLDRRTFLGSTAALAGSAAFVAQAQSADAADPAALGQTPHTKFAVNIEMWFGKLPFLDRIKATAALGFPAIEFWPWQNRDIDAMSQLTQELNLAVAQFTAWGFDPGLNNPKNHDNFVQAIEDGCQVAKKLKAKKMCVVAGNNQPGMSQEEMLANVVTGLKRAAPIAEEHDVVLILEPMNGRVDHPGHCLYGSVDAVNICREVKSTHVKINWDLYHMQISEGDLCGRLKDGFDQAGYLQLADHPGRNEPGTGEIHYNRVLRQAYELGYRDFVGLECRPKTTELAAAQGVAAADVW